MTEKNRKRKQLCLRLPDGVWEVISGVARQKGLSLNDYCETLFQDVLEQNGYKVSRVYSVKSVARLFDCSPFTVRRWLSENPSIPVLNRGNPGMRVPDSSVKLLQSKMLS